jgi:hypothetical protein
MADGSPIRPFKYRSIKAIHKQKILEQRREELEVEHYTLAEHIDTLDSLPPLEDEVQQQQRVEAIKQTRERLAVIESMVETYNKKLLDVREESDEEENG